MDLNVQAVFVSVSVILVGSGMLLNKEDQNILVFHNSMRSRQGHFFPAARQRSGRGDRPCYNVT